MSQRFVIEKDGERQNVTDLDGYDGWTLVSEVPDEIPDHEAELVDGAWVIPIDIRRARVWSAVKALRAEKEDGAASTPYGPIDCDDRSKIKISGLVQTAQLLGSDFSVEFTMADNSVQTLTAAQMIDLGLSVSAHVDVVYGRARALREEIDASTDPESIDIEAGW